MFLLRFCVCVFFLRLEQKRRDDEYENQIGEIRRKAEERKLQIQQMEEVIIFIVAYIYLKNHSKSKV